jgi:hypothetical protein
MIVVEAIEPASIVFEGTSADCAVPAPPGQELAREK